MIFKSSRAKTVTVTQTHYLSILWAGMCLFICAGYGLALYLCRSQRFLFWCLFAAAVFALGSAVFLLVRALLFRRKLMACARRLMANEYRT